MESVHTFTQIQMWKLAPPLLTAKHSSDYRESQQLAEEVGSLFWHFSLCPPHFQCLSASFSLPPSIHFLWCLSSPPLPPWQPLPSSPPLEAQLTSVATGRCASKQILYLPGFDIPIAACILTSEWHSAVSDFLSLRQSNFDRKLFTRQGFRLYIRKLTTRNRHFIPSWTIPCGRICFQNILIWNQPETADNLIGDGSGNAGQTRLIWVIFVLSLCLLEARKHLQTDRREQRRLLHRLQAVVR